MTKIQELLYTMESEMLDREEELESYHEFRKVHLAGYFLVFLYGILYGFYLV